MAETKKNLFAEFPPVTTQQWEDVIAKDLKGADYEKKLVWKTMEGFNVRPYYRAEDLEGIKHLGSKPGEFPFVRGTKENNEWLVRQTIVVECAKAANATALDVLMRGVDSLNFEISNKEFTATDLDQLLNGISIKSVELNFTGCGVNGVAELFIAKIKNEKLAADDVVASFSIDPIIKKMTLKGKDVAGCSGETVFQKVKTLVEAAGDYKRIKFITVNGDTFGNCGSTIVQELAFTLATAHDYIVGLMDAGLDINDAARTIKFNFSVSSTYFMEIAKFRAARMLWANIVKQYNPTSTCAQKMRAHAVTSMWSYTIYDPYVNMLRATTEAMSAALAGVSSIEVMPFDSAYETPTEFSSRIARNVQLLLKEESHIDQVVDPAGGSYYVESLTQSVAEEAWKLFQTVEAKGGYTEAFKAGFVVEQISASAAKKEKNIATRKDTLLGTNQYPNFTEKVASNVKDKNEGQCSCKKEAIYTPLKKCRGGEGFEALRLNTERSGKEPVAFMLTVGNLAFARARAQFSCNFFACAGINVLDNNLFGSIEDGMKAAKEAKANIIVLCSSDEDYSIYAPELQAAVGSEGIMVIAGEPACREELEAKGIKNFISVRSNVLETLEQYQNELGIK